MKVCVKAHRNESFGEVPYGSLWEDDHEVVAADPRAFRVVRDGQAAYEVEDDEVED